MIICYSMLEDSPNQPALRLPRVDHTSCEDFDRATSILEIQRSFRISWCRGGGYGGKIMSFFFNCYPWKPFGTAWTYSQKGRGWLRLIEIHTQVSDDTIFCGDIGGTEGPKTTRTSTIFGPEWLPIWATNTSTAGSWLCFFGGVASPSHHRNYSSQVTLPSLPSCCAWPPAMC